MSQVNMKAAWEDLHVNPRFQPVYPHEFVVRWAFQNFRNLKGARLLDLGCGTGRHALFFAQEGFEAYATDISATGVAETQRRAAEKGLKVIAKTEALHALSFAPDFFEGIMSYGVLNYASFDQIAEGIARIYTQLKLGGKLFIVMRGMGDWRLSCAEQIDPHHYKMTKLGAGTPSDVEQGMIQCYLSVQQIEELLSKFKTVTIDRLTLTWQNGKFQDEDYLIQAEK